MKIKPAAFLPQIVSSMQTNFLNVFKITIFFKFIWSSWPKKQARSKDGCQGLLLEPLNFFLMDDITVLYVERSALAAAFCCEAF